MNGEETGNTPEWDGNELSDEIVIPGDPNQLVAVRHFLTRMARISRVPENVIDDIVIAVDEACSNILDHNYPHQSRLSMKLHVRAIITNTTFTIVITDQGQYFNPTKHKQPDPSHHLKNMKSRGMGIFIISRLMDEMHHEYLEGIGNILTLIKKYQR